MKVLVTSPPSASSVSHNQPTAVRRAVAEFLRIGGPGVSHDERVASRRTQQTFIDLCLKFIGIDESGRNGNAVEVNHRSLEIANTRDLDLYCRAAFLDH